MLLFLRFFIFSFFISASFYAQAQYSPQFYLRFTETSEREKAHTRIIEKGILQNLSSPLTDDTEEEWQAAFTAMEVIGYRDNFTRQKMEEAIHALADRSTTFQRRVLQTAYLFYPGAFVTEVERLMDITETPRIFSMCAVYLLKSDTQYHNTILSKLNERFADSLYEQAILSRLHTYMTKKNDFTQTPTILKTILSKSFLPGQTIMYSFQRKNRDFPGLVMVRHRNGDFIRMDGDIFHIPQLARGVADLPYFLTKGNTPQGIYRMFGFGVSESQYIGPTANVQMGMPIEISKKKFFFPDKNVSTTWTLNDYADLLPSSIKDYEPLYESYYAGAAGRNEIIAHGTTVNPEYYAGTPFYPLTPTEGCLSTKELWNGKVVHSDQQRLVNALLAAGGAYGYVVVIEVDDKEEPVSLNDILKFIE